MEHLFGLASECRRQINRRNKTFVSTLHCSLENGADIYICKRASEDMTLKKEEEERRRKKKNAK